MRSVHWFLCFGFFLFEFHGFCFTAKKHKGKEESYVHSTVREEIPKKRTAVHEVKRQKGAVLERWDGIDGYLVRKLLEDPRFPDMPTYLSYTSTFSEPIDWGNNYGSRIRGYFVPEQSGPHVFFIESDNQGQLFLSITDNPDEKILICWVGKDHESLPMQFRKYPEQESYPINLKKGSYYYIEALHKDQYGNDSLAVAVKTPDKKFHAPIPSQYLWTMAPPKPQANESAPSMYLVRVAAQAGARAGASLGVNEASKSGARAGALAGAAAGQKAGAEAGAEAAAEAATEVATKTLKEALAKMGALSKPTFNIYTGNGSVIPMQPGATSQNATSGSNETGTTTGAVEEGQAGQTGATGQTGVTQTGQTGQTGSEASYNVSVTTGGNVGVPGAPVGAAHPGIYHGAFVYNREVPYYVPPANINSHIVARHKEFLDTRGLARVLVNGALYVVHSFDVPASQNPMYNLCWRITNGKLELTQNCQAFAIKIPGFDKGTGEHQTISFESVCAPGHYIRQKNYRFVLGTKGDTKFDYDASAAFFQVFSLPGAFQFSLMRKGWYICRSINKDYHQTAIVTDYNMASDEWLKRCSFALRPLAAHENPLMNCLDTAPPPKLPGIPAISPTVSTPSQANKTTPTTRPTTVPTTPHKDDGPCLNFTFWNTAGVPFILYTSLKPDGYLVTGPKLHLHYVIRDGQVIGLKQIPHKRGRRGNDVEVLSEVMDELSDSQQVFLDRPKIAARQIVTFWAKDPSGKREILLDGKKKVYAIPGLHCWHYVQVTVTSRPKPSPSTTKPTTIPTTLRPSPPPPSSTLPPAPPSMPITSAPPPPPPTKKTPHIHIHFHTHPARFPPPTKPTYAPPPPPPATPEPSPPSIKPTKPPPPPSPPPPTSPPPTVKVTLPPCKPPVTGVTLPTLRPCLPTNPPVTKPPSTTLPPCSPSPGPLPPGAPPCKPIPGPPVLPPCSPESPPPCAPLPVPPPSPPPVSQPSCSPSGIPQTPGTPPPCVSPPSPPDTPPPVLSVTLPTLPPITTLPPVSGSLIIQGCMPTHGGTSKGACCMFPFTFQGNPQHRCTRAERGYRWCSTTGNYDADKQWGFCATCFLCYGGNSNGNCCHFPFVYGGKMYTTCTTQDETRPWCATTYNYDVDKQWGYCGGDAPGSVPQAKISYAPCPSDCDGKCVDTCPDYCCVKGKTSETTKQSQPAVAPQPIQVQQVSAPQQTSQSCPAICAKTCAPDCPVRCCNFPLPSPYVPSPPPAPTYCPQICYSSCVSYCPTDCCTSAKRGFNRNTLSYTVSLPCPTNCFPSCHGNCPPQCCKAGNNRNRLLPHPAMKSLDAVNYRRTPGVSNVPFMDLPSPSASTIMIRSKLPCPDFCKKECPDTCSEDCCKRHQKGNNEEQQHHTASLDCKDSVATIGGNARGSCCNFPFIYKGAVYWRCTAQDAVKKWCSVTKVFDLDKRWGYCT
ncbi:hypothetical protein ACROYT_G003385 [Oculina patagonica]